MIIRLARQEDLPAIVTIFNESAALPVNDEKELISVKSRQSWFDQFDSQHPLWVVVQNGEVVAWCGLEAFYHHPAYRYSAEISIYVANRAHRQGIGRKLLTFVDQQAPVLNLHTIIAYIYQPNIASQHLFEKAAYQYWGQLKEISRLNHHFHSLEIYGKNF